MDPSGAAETVTADETARRDGATAAVAVVALAGGGHQMTVEGRTRAGGSTAVPRTMPMSRAGEARGWFPRKGASLTRRSLRMSPARSSTGACGSSCGR